MVQRLTISLDDELAAALDGYMAERSVSNRSEAIRDLIRHALMSGATEEAGDCVAAVSYVYDHHERQLGSRLIRHHHDNHDLAVSTLHVHIDHHHCLEMTVLRGPGEAVRRLAEATLAERGVQFGQVNLIPLKDHGGHHHHDDDRADHAHQKPAF